MEKFNDGYYVEALDRTHCVQEIIENMLLGHVLIDSNEDWKKKIIAAQTLLGEVYQSIGEQR